MNPTLLDFFKELFSRLGQKSPKFFKSIQIVAGILTVLSGVPALLDTFHVVIPFFLTEQWVKFVAIAAAVGTFLTGLPVENPSVPSTTKLPFTAKAKIEAIKKAT